jgi:hypothetical protein
MTYRGRIENGVVVLKGPGGLPDGTEVSVRPLKAKRRSAKEKKRGPTVRKTLLKLAGKAKGLPADAARNVDHYLYGRPTT